MSLTRNILCLGLLWALGSCSPDEPEQSGRPEQAASKSAASAQNPDWPEDTVLALEGEPITASQVDLDSEGVLHLALDSSERHLRRQALMNRTLPNAIAAHLAGPRRAEVRKEALALREELQAGKQQGPTGASIWEGGYGNLGLGLWAEALKVPVEGWTPLVEEGGAFLFAQVLERQDYRIPAGTTMKLAVHKRAFMDAVDPNQVIEEAKDKLHLEIIDPSWRLIVPELTQYRMGVHE